MPADHQRKRPTTPRESEAASARTRAAKIRRPRRSDLGAALGASRSFAGSNKPHGPFAVAALREEIQRRLVSRGGRPSDPGPTIRRLVPIKKQVWRILKAQAAFLSGQGKRVSPAQLAAVLVGRVHRAPGEPPKNQSHMLAQQFREAGAREELHRVAVAVRTPVRGHLLKSDGKFVGIERPPSRTSARGTVFLYRAPSAAPPAQGLLRQ